MLVHDADPAGQHLHDTFPTKTAEQSLFLMGESENRSALRSEMSFPRLPLELEQDNPVTGSLSIGEIRRTSRRGQVAIGTNGEDKNFATIASCHVEGVTGRVDNYLTYPV